MIRVIKVVLLLAAAVLVLGGGALTFWINILNGTQYSPSNDTTGTRRIVLSTTFTVPIAGAAWPEERTRTWVLNIPRKHIVREHSDFTFKRRLVVTSLQFNVQTGEMQANPHVFTNEPGWSILAIHLTPEFFRPAIRSMDATTIRT